MSEAHDDIDHDEELAPPEVLEALPPRRLTPKQIEAIFDPEAASKW